MKKLYIYLVAFVGIVSIISCSEDFLEVNQDGDNPTSPNIPLILTNAQNSTVFAFIEGQGLNDVVGQFTHYYSRRYAWTKYQPDGQTFGNRVGWAAIYDALMDYQVIINNSETKGNLIYAGIAKTMKAYMISEAVDTWGDIPYFHAASVIDSLGGINSSTENLSPVFDDDELIYQDILLLLDEAKSDLTNTSALNSIVPSSDDLIYGGDVNKWIKAINTIKLNLYNKIRNTSLYNANEVNELLNGPLFESSADDFQYLFDGSSNSNKHFLHQTEYTGGQEDYQISPWLYETMKGYRQDIFTGLEDPRIPYYFYKQLLPGEFPAAGVDPQTGKVKVDYWDSTTGFFGIRFGSDGIDKDHAARGSATYVGVYPVGGLYDDGGGKTLGAEDGSGIAPFQFLTYHDLLFIQTEMAQVGLINADPAVLLEAAMQAHEAKVNSVVTVSGSSAPVLNMDTYISDVIAEFTTASNEQKLDIIMTQKWIANFGGNKVESYNDKRRTGFPTYPNPNGPQEYNVPQYNDGTNYWNYPASETNISNPFMVSMPWQTSELDRNINAPEQKDIYSYKIFWDN